MINKTIYNKINYKQSGDYCVLASYAVSSIPFLNPQTEIIDFFLAFCNHYNITADKSNAEGLYLNKFITEYSRPGMSGYKVIETLHKNSTNELFVRCSQSFSLVPKSTIIEIAEINNELINSECCLMLFIDRSINQLEYSSMHSVTVFYDDGFWIYDVNKGGINKIDSISSLGQLGESFIIKRIST